MRWGESSVKWMKMGMAPLGKGSIRKNMWSSGLNILRRGQIRCCNDV